MEWHDAYRFAPPKDGTWIIAVNSDYSGLEFLSYSLERQEWIDGSGYGGLFDDENFGIHYQVWTLAPKHFRIYIDNHYRAKDYEEWSARALRKSRP